ncbi:MAG: ribonuclease HI family protein [Candidatus Micrarchaeota archaeon]|nr:ribonuclease HI family protein [Candidatus Micrarchaeota archaeon]
MLLYIYTDGAARENPGPSASGFVIFDESKKLVAKSFFYNGNKTNNIAEYLAIIAALKKVLSEYGEQSEVKLFSDSELVINQLQGNYKVRDPKLKALHKEAHQIISKLKSCSFANVPRENKFISMVDAQLNRLLDQKRDRGEEILKEGEQKRL